jgi:hypothetical protein
MAVALRRCNGDEKSDFGAHVAASPRRISKVRIITIYRCPEGEADPGG